MRRQVVLFGIVLCCALTGAAEEELRPMTARDLARLEIMESAAISPDGSTIAAIKSIPRELFVEEDGPDWEELFLIDRASGAARPFVTGDVNVSRISWLPDSSAVSFLAKRGDDEFQRLYRIPVDGGEATPILSLGSEATDYDWSPDGRQVAVIAPRALTPEQEALEQQGFDQEIFEEDWLPSEVFIATLDSEVEPRALELDGSAVQARWNPDGRRIAVAVAPSPLVDDRLMFQTVHIVDSLTSKILGTVKRQGKMGRMAWSPDGAWLGMISAADLHDPSASSLLVATADGGRPVDLTEGFEGSVVELAWVDNETMVVLADVGVHTELYRVPVSGEPPTPIGLRTGGVVYTAMSVADDGRQLALVGDSNRHPSEVFAMDLEGGIMPLRLSGANPWLREIALAPQEIVRHKARDGLELEGILIRPLGGSNGPAPLVMVVHGGPEAHRRDGWLSRYSAPAQVLAGRGYAVFYPNYRGSTGRGVEFAKLGQKDAAGAEFDDLVDAVDHLIEIGIADRDRIGVTGGSYGGYATAWLATRYSERFAAGVMFVGIANKISKFGTTDIAQEETLVHARSYPWEKWQFFMERSPLYHVEKGRTPLLIMGGDADPRVSPTQSMEMYRALKTLGKAPVRLVRYPDEGHGNRRAASRYDYQLRLVRWFDHFLLGAGGDPPPHQLDYTNPEFGWPAADEE